MTTIRIQRVAVIGAGTMGSQVAGYLADQGLQIDLFDLEGRARKAWEGMVKAGSSTFKGRSNITPRTVGKDDATLAGADLILEAVFEDAAAKELVHSAMEKHAKPACILTTNTSGISINALADKRSPEFRKRFFGLHFFNPLKHMPLAELTPGRETDMELFRAFCSYTERTIGKGVVVARDTPNFIANRVGGFALFCPFRLATPGLTVADIDLVFKTLFGWEPLKTWDIVGMALASPVAGNVYDRATDDPCREMFHREIKPIEELISKGFSGRGSKSKSGFHALGEKRSKLMYDFATGRHVPAAVSPFASLKAAAAAKFPESAAALFAGDDEAAEFARKSFFGMVAYSAAMVGRICDEMVEIDRAMRWGFNWPRGPFELAQAYGFARTLEGIDKSGYGEMVPAWFRELAAGKKPQVQLSAAPRVEEGVYPEELLKESSKHLFKNDEAVVIDFSTVAAPMCLVTFTSRGNAAGLGTLEALHRALDWAEAREGAVVVGNNGRDFCPGANLRYMLDMSEAGNSEAISKLIRSGQVLTQRLTYSPALTVAAPHGFTLGGGSEISLGCKKRVLNARVTWGQPEINPGVVPAWGGCMRLLRTMMRGLQTYYLWGEFWTREVAGDHIDPVWRLISWAEMSRDGYHAKEMGFLEPSDTIVPAQGLGQPHVLAQARRAAEATLHAGFRVQEPFVFNLPGKALQSRFQLICDQGALGGMFPKHNARVAAGVATILCGGDTHLGEPVTEQKLLDLEHDIFMELAMTKEAQACMRRVLKI